MTTNLLLTEDIFSVFSKGYLYGPKGEVVKLISTNEHVLIVEGKKGRFPVNVAKTVKLNDKN